MRTQRLTVDPDRPGSPDSRAALETAAKLLRSGGIVAFPTETVYGLGANALSSDAVKRIFQAKERPSWDPLIVHVADRTMLLTVASRQEPSLTSSAEALMAAFWPGPLTLLLPKSRSVPDLVTAGRPLVGVRMPAHPVAQALISSAGLPIAAPSANRFRRISPTQAAHVLEDLDGRIDAVLDAGETLHGVESTVVDASQDPVVLYRPGVISLQMLREVCGSAVVWKPEPHRQLPDRGEPASMPSPGLEMRHYAPQARLVLIEGTDANGAKALLYALSQALSHGQSVGVMLPRNYMAEGEAIPEGAAIFDWGAWDDLPMLAHRLFAGLRHLDSAGVSTIICPLPAAAAIGAAIRDRLLKAARTE